MPKRDAKHPPEYLLATDLDGTLVGCRQSLGTLNRVIKRHRSRILLVYITGRLFSSARRLVESDGLLTPDVLVSDVGTEIHVAPKFIRNAGWETKIGSTWNPAEIRSLFANVNNLIMQPIRPRFRLSYTTDSGNHKAVLAQLCEMKRELKLPVEIISSLGRIIDVLPEGAGKGPALRFVQKMRDVADHQVIVCGDSGNDYSMFVQGFRGIVVGNACPDFRRQLTGTEGGVHFASAHYAAGILEGLQNFGLFDG
ncbi:HAD-IIB family hydrolase [Anaeroselena agilis]|uniref:HAD-IIB family hydrolase n=1 Tax=Anaeroselena agilis TaxID=3063788 RepID=A0ABU3P4D7_9FIRM|nr:HAD-IIB family hydrolase [Selenomonadales bacterium 4137-cl]